MTTHTTAVDHPSPEIAAVTARLYENRCDIREAGQFGDRTLAQGFKAEARFQIDAVRAAEPLIGGT